MIQNDDIISKLDEFPTLPTIYSTLLELLSNPRTTIQDVAFVIQKDQTSVVKILKVVNSSVYSLQTKVDSISQAVFFLGFNEVRNIVLALSILEIFQHIQTKVNFSIVDLWKHSIAVGVITRLLGIMNGVKDIENYFISGIVHDIGKLFFLQILNEKYLKVIDYAFTNQISLYCAEKQLLQMSHDFIGDMVAQKWKIPISIRRVIKYHSLNTNLTDLDMHISCVHLADIIAHIMQLGNPGYEFVEQPNSSIWKFFNNKNEQLESMYDTILINFEESISILNIK